MAKETGFKIYTSIERPAKGIVEQYRGFVAANISDSMSRLFTMDYRVGPVYKPMSKLCGTAITVQARPGDNLLSLKAIEIAQPGDVIVIATQGDTSLSVWGGFMSMMAAKKGIAGVVTDGVIRDVEQSRETGLPIYAVGVTPAAPTKEGAGQINTSISCGGVVVEPGDIVVGDEDGVVVVPRREAEAVVEKVRERIAKEDAWLKIVEGGGFIAIDSASEIIAAKNAEIK
ncbi:MAG: RraA family protein [Clostridia bacterium]|nr:RraA family protein [Clostridia bacterium]